MNTLIDPRSLLSQPFLYSLFEDSLGAKKFRRKFCREIVRDSSNDRVLDAGCGTADILEFLSFKEYVGIDKSPRYIGYARKKHVKNATFETMNIVSDDLAGLGSFDLVMALGLFHHLPDPSFLSVLRRIRPLLKPGGRLISFDGCYHEQQGLFSKGFVSVDRGKHVRSLEGYADMAKTVFRDVKAVLWSNELRIPYSHCIMEIR